MKNTINTPLTFEKVKNLKCGDSVFITGTIYTARDSAHKRLFDVIKNNGELPFDIKDTIIYYVGPTPSKDNQVIGSAGPTTSYRMDAYSGELIRLGQRGMIGKGTRDRNVIDNMKKYGAVYFGAIGGAGAVLSRCIKSSEVISYSDLGPEAIRKLEVENFPVLVIIDCYGNNLYEIGPKEYLKTLGEN